MEKDGVAGRLESFCGGVGHGAWIALGAIAFVAAWAFGSGGGPPDRPIGEVLSLWWVLPFAGILLSIALFPLIAPHFWHHHYPKVAAAWGLLLSVPLLLAYGTEARHAILHIFALDYVPFLVLLWALYTVSGGIVLRGAPAGTPGVNTLLLLIGTLVASWTGTTGAAMLLVRPVIRANAHRKHKTHTLVFFTFLVANIGGSLTPLGDPPLFLGFLQGVPFFWTLRLFPMMALATAILLTAYFLLDRFYYRRERPAPPTRVSGERLGVDGLVNLVFLAGIIGSVLLSGVWRPGEIVFDGLHLGVQNLVRDLLLVSMAVLSMRFTPRTLREKNGFTWEPIREVAILFAGIFATILPALAILRAGETGAMAALIRQVREPGDYFWIAGALSGVLDNAPTYLSFFAMQLGSFYPGMPVGQAVPRLVAEHGIYLEALSVGAVFMGANTYIGNAPNFMVRSIAEEAGVAMPSFFGYIFRWTLPFLIPTFLLVGWVFF
jgi:Na+/H+ antiporter NhaD/arsenite permease-like protein